VLALDPLGRLGYTDQQRPPLSNNTRCDVRQNAKGYAELHNNGKEIWCSRCVRRLRDNAAHLCDGGGAAGSLQIKCDYCNAKRHTCTADTAPPRFQHRVRMTALSLTRRSSDVNKQAFQNALEAWSSKFLVLAVPDWQLTVIAVVRPIEALLTPSKSKRMRSSSARYKTASHISFANSSRQRG
jgi:hypothetical protein